MPTNSIDWPGLHRVVLAQFALPEDCAHGPAHWQRVRENGLALAAITGARPDVLQLFALFHDARRLNEFEDPEHGWRGAELARSLRGRHFEIDDAGFRLLFLACAGHTEIDRSHDITIGTCLDADRLDLPRVGICPGPAHMSTRHGAALARERLYQPLKRK